MPNFKLTPAIVFIAVISFTLAAIASYLVLSTLDKPAIDTISTTDEVIALCGNNVIDANEVCDDNNVDNFDLCSADCTNECEAGLQWNPTTLNCDAEIPASGGICGDNNIDPEESCDDGNTANFDACSSDCLNACVGGEIWGGTECISDTQSPGAQCGNNIIEEGEECDDGNPSSGDGCNWYCKNEAPGSIACGELDVPTGSDPFYGDGEISLVDFVDFIRTYDKLCGDTPYPKNLYGRDTCGGKDSNQRASTISNVTGDGRISLVDFQYFVSKYGQGSCLENGD